MPKRKRTQPYVVTWRRAIRDTETLTTTEKAVAWTLAEYWNAEGTSDGSWGGVSATGCGPSYGSIAKGASVDRSTAMRAVKRLETKGWLRRTYTAGPGRTHTNRWEAITPENVKPKEEEVDPYADYIRPRG
jgi:hypothetical protein